MLAIAAAKCGATVVATDIDARAVAAAADNAKRNAVVIETRVGSLFADAEGPFDVILANLPNEIVPLNVLEVSDPVATRNSVDRRAFDGGPGGNTHLLTLLAIARDYMHPQSRLYLGVHSLTDFHGTLRAMLSHYVVRLIDVERLPAKAFVSEHLAFYQALDHAGIIHMAVSADGRCMARGVPIFKWLQVMIRRWHCMRSSDFVKCTAITIESNPVSISSSVVKVAVVSLVLTPAFDHTTYEMDPCQGTT